MASERTSSQRQANDTIVELVLEATRSLLTMSTAVDGQRIAVDFVQSLGGMVVPAATADADALPVDLSFGVGPPVLPWAPGASLARMYLERHLPVLVEDIRTAVARLDKPPTSGAFVAFSEIDVPAAGQAALESAFRGRLGSVDAWPGFRSLEVWADTQAVGRYVMVSWWDSQDAFKAYMGSEDHRRSHRRIPRGPDRPVASAFRRYRLVTR
jgi:heme-degrading monooxygenase HmoA